MAGSALQFRLSIYKYQFHCCIIVFVFLTTSYEYYDLS
jgi:hypothetical protein